LTLHCTRHIQLQGFQRATSCSTRLQLQVGLELRLAPSCEINVRSDLHRPHPKGLPGGYDMLIHNNNARIVRHTVQNIHQNNY